MPAPVVTRITSAFLSKFAAFWYFISSSLLLLEILRLSSITMESKSAYTVGSNVTWNIIPRKKMVIDKK